MSVPPPNKALSDLVEVVGDESAREIVRIFLHDFPVSVREIGQGDRDKQALAAHGLKSSARLVGAQHLAIRMAAIETKLNLPGEELRPDEVKEAKEEFESLAPALRAYAEGG